MTINRRRLVGLSAAALLAIGGGCGGGRPDVDSGTEEVTVSGKVTLDGKPAAGNSISFDPSNVERKDAKATTAQIGEDGSYTLTTLVGQNRVSFSGPDIGQHPDIINSAYMRDLQSGENTIDFALPLDEGTSGG